MLKMRNLLFWAVFPLLIPQALYVRRVAPRFAPAAGPVEGSVGAGEQLRLLAIGDSIIAGVGAAELKNALVGRTAEALASSKACHVSWQAIGASGYDAQKALERLVPRMPEAPFDDVIVSIGLNDVTGLTSIRAWRRNLSQILHQLRAHSPNAMIAVAGMPPLSAFPLLPQPLRALLGMRGRVFDEATRDVVSKYENVVHVALDFEAHPDKFSADGYHPSEESYVEFGRQMADRLLAIE